MISQQVFDKKGKIPVVRCVICHNETKKKPQIIQLGVDFCIICPDCVKQFTRKDMEFMYNMFSAFGGFFGQLKDSKKSIYDAIKQLTNEFNIQKEHITLKSDIQLLHKAFLYGIAPNQIVQGLQLI
ncbi:MAG: hypothetical protein ACFE85_11390 [Candidatus Hodarchaeota archaeon]